MIRIVLAGSVSAGISIIGLRIAGIAIPNIVFVLFSFFYIGFIGISRMSYRIIRRLKLYNPLKKRAKLRRQRVMIIGAGDAAAHEHVPLMEHNPAEAIKNNVFGTLNVAEFADKYKAKRFVFISTDKAVNPTNIMGATKRIAEMIVQAMGKQSQTEYMAVRFGNVLGSNGSVIPLFKKQIAESGPITVTCPEINRFFMTIPETVQLVIQAGTLAKGGEIFVLDMGQPVKIIDIAKDLIRLSDFEPGVDIEIKYAGLRPGEKLYEELLMAEEDLTFTKHAKIFIGKPTFSDLDALKEDLEKLKYILFGTNGNIVSFIETLVPPIKEIMP